VSRQAAPIRVGRCAAPSGRRSCASGLPEEGFEQKAVSRPPEALPTAFSAIPSASLMLKTYFASTRTLKGLGRPARSPQRRPRPGKRRGGSLTRRGVAPSPFGAWHSWGSFVAMGVACRGEVSI
jgi:hypothetical protein